MPKRNKKERRRKHRKKQVSLNEVPYPKPKEDRKENSLTAPLDRDKSKKWKPDQGASPLSEKEVKQAITCLVNKDYHERFREIERKYVDSAVPFQRIALVSFVPASGAIPNERGVYGFAKVRGSYNSLEEADERSEYIIRNDDSYHQIYWAEVGKPFPITNSSDYSRDVKRVDLQQEMTRTISEDIRRKREKDQKNIEEIKERENRLMEDNEKIKERNKQDKIVLTPEEELDRYVTIRNKKAQLTYHYLEVQERIGKMITILAKTRKEVEEFDEKDPTLKERYFDKYMEARKKANLDKQSHKQNFIKYMVEDVKIPEVDDEYIKLFENKETEEENHELVPIPEEEEESVLQEESEEENLEPLIQTDGGDKIEDELSHQSE